MKNYHTLAVCLTTAFALQTASAQVPHQFEANTPAVAPEVNENFDHLVNEVNTVKTDLDTAENNINSLQNILNAHSNDISNLNSCVCAYQASVKGFFIPR